MSGSISKFISEDVYDMAARTGTLAKSVGVDKSQISNILSTFESIPNPLDAIKFTLVFISRQVPRNEIPEEVARQLIKDLSKIAKTFHGEELKTAVRKYLYLFKWFYEGGTGKRASGFEDYINSLIR